ncbi:EAL domain-containing protein [Lentibacillus cibarius]|uniref:EAL domain-containing protein n=1 Tax=Lentibacillus cibarius TaxID=2583219 RepID=A0A549YJU5_9BACI|nr:EAL domain-containing protein [Lentibacillus cibarius]TRM12155.1 EAL domain-containing protein [Lentibacillus cibarius]
MPFPGVHDIHQLVYDSFHQSKQGLAMINHNGDIIMANTAFYTITSIQNETFDFHQFSSLALIDDTKKQDIQLALQETGSWEGKIWFNRQEGELSSYWLTVESFHTSSSEGLYFSITLTQANDPLEKRKEVHFLAYNDPLTKLSNRISFEKTFHAIFGENRNTYHIGALLFIDLDRFKLINDTFGHSCGDLLLKNAAERLRSCLHRPDLIARLGGDEFVCMLPFLDDEQAAIETAKDIIAAFSRPFTLHENELHVTVSIGISFHPHDGDNFETLLTQADSAMYRAKKAGRNNYATSKAELHASHFEHLQLENMLHNAIAGEQLVLYYQPQVNADTGQINAVEALVRWEHPEYGIISPGDFIPIAEESGLITEIDEWVLRTACWQNVQWQRKRYEPVKVSVNISTQQFMQKNLPNKIADVLADTQMDPTLLEIEITETMVMQDTDLSARQVERIRHMGVKVAIDDFGTGYSSFQYLKHFPADTLKIDRVFVKDVDTNDNSRSIMKSIINLGHELNMRVIAEGVETQQQLLQLRHRSIDDIQGFLFHKPMPAAHNWEKLFRKPTQ